MSAITSDFPAPVGSTMMALFFFALLAKKLTAASLAFC
jgi:dipeptide/tripeptide permease